MRVETAFGLKFSVVAAAGLMTLVLWMHALGLGPAMLTLGSAIPGSQGSSVSSSVAVAPSAPTPPFRLSRLLPLHPLGTAAALTGRLQARSKMSHPTLRSAPVVAPSATFHAQGLGAAPLTPATPKTQATAGRQPVTPIPTPSPVTPTPAPTAPTPVAPAPTGTATAPPLPPQAPPPPGATVTLPVVSQLPTVAGQSAVGQTLSATAGTWTGSPSSFAYQWQRCTGTAPSCTPIAGASSLSYKLTALDVGMRLRIQVTGINAAGAATASSGLTSTVPTTPPAQPTLPGVSQPPTVAGQAVVGQTLAATTGTWTGDPSSYAYQWKRCTGTAPDCASIAGATSSTYKVVSLDVGTRLRIQVTGSNTAGSAVATSALTSTVAGLPPVTISLGSSVVDGSTLTGTVTWTATATATGGAQIASVSFSIDSSARSTDTSAPYTYGTVGILDTKTLANGSHSLAVIATTANGTTTTLTSRVTVQNQLVVIPPPPPPPTISSSIAAYSTLSGAIQWSVSVANVPTSHISNVAFTVDGTPRGSATAYPYAVSLDTTTLTNGTHSFVAVVTATEGTFSSSVQAVVQNTVTPPHLTFSVSQSIATSSTLYGQLAWSAGVSGVTASQISSVTFSVDGTVRSTATAYPFTATLDTRTLTNGTHTFAVAARGIDGTVVTTTVQATVHNG